MGCKASKEEFELEGSMLSVTAAQPSELDSQTLITNDKFVSSNPVFSSESKVSQSIDLFSPDFQQTNILDNADNASEELQRKTSAVSKIQRQARRKKTVREARTEQQWKMFANLDVQDEAEMLHLAVFMQTLIDLIPTSPRALNGLRSLNATSSETNTATESTSTMEVVESGFESDAALTTEVVLVNSGRKRSKSNIENSDEYNITSANITIGMAKLLTYHCTFIAQPFHCLRKI